MAVLLVFMSVQEYPKRSAPLRGNVGLGFLCKTLKNVQSDNVINIICQSARNLRNVERCVDGPPMPGSL